MEQSSNEKRVGVVAASTALLAAIGWIDYATNNELELFVFYSIPISLLAWHLGRGPVIVMCLACTITWFVIGIVTGQAYSSGFYRYWKTGIVLASFLTNGLTLWKIQTSRRQVRKLAAELAQAQNELKKLNSPDSVCPACKQPRIELQDGESAEITSRRS